MRENQWRRIQEERVREAAEIAGCRKCRFRARIPGCGGQVCCNYLEITGHSRGCRVIDCTHGSSSGVKEPLRPLTSTKYNRSFKRKGKELIDISPILMRALEEKDMSANDLKRQVGVSGTSIRNWLNGTSRPTGKNLQKVAEVLGLDIEMLTGGNTKNGKTGPDTPEGCERIIQVPGAGCAHVLPYQASRGSGGGLDRGIHPC